MKAWLKRFVPNRSLPAYLQDYARGHQSRANRVLHMVGTPMILASIPLALVVPPLAGLLFVTGWGLQFVGHYAFEGQGPRFVDEPLFFLIGPIWVGLEWAEVLGLPVPWKIESILQACDSVA
jgi:uncharacterized membrane protein YGL010W